MEAKGGVLSGTVIDIAEARKRRLTLTSRALLAHMEFASFLSPTAPSRRARRS